MVSLANRRSVLTIFSGLTVYSHQVRMMLTEKSIEADIVDVDPVNKPEDLLDINPYGTLPTLLDRDLVLYEPHVIMEYLDERFPHPPLMPVYPVERAKTRMMMYRMNKDWFSLYDAILRGDELLAQRSRDALTMSLASVAQIFTRYSFFMHDEFSVLDCCFAPLLWRLPSLNITLPESAESIIEYGEKIFAREAFQRSLTEYEREIR